MATKLFTKLSLEDIQDGTSELESLDVQPEDVVEANDNVTDLEVKASEADQQLETAVEVSEDLQESIIKKLVSL